MYDLIMMLDAAFRFLILALIWSAAILYVEHKEYGNAEIDWQNCQATPGHSTGGTNTAWLSCLAVTVVCFADVCGSWPVTGFSVVVAVLLLATGVAMTIDIYRFAKKLQAEAAGRANKRLKRLKMRREQDRKLFFGRRWNIDLEEYLFS